MATNSGWFLSKTSISSIIRQTQMLENTGDDKGIEDGTRAACRVFHADKSLCLSDFLGDIQNLLRLPTRAIYDDI